MSSSTDPFHPAHSDLLQSLTSISSLISSHARIASSSTSGRNPELAESANDLTTALTDARSDLVDLQGSVDAVARSPARFGLSEGEVERRRGLVREVRGRLEELEGRARGVLEGGSGERRDSAGGGYGGMEEGEGEEDEYAEWETQRQEEIFAEQDVQLEGVGHTIGTLRAQADDIGREVGQQAMELEDVDNIVDRVGGKIATGRQRVGDVLRRGEERCGGCCIGVLIVALIILLILALVL